MVSLLVESPRPAIVRNHPYAPWFAVAAVCLGAFMGQLDASIVTLAFPAMQHGFHATLAQVQWVSLAYLLVVVALLVPVGRWSDRYGRKLVYVQGFAVFTLASAACGFAWSLPVLIALRVVQGAGAAMLQANSVALVTTSVPGTRRRAALGSQAAAQALGLAAGPTVGGLLVGSVGWRWIFLGNVPVGILALIAGRYLLPRTLHRTDGRRVDPMAVALLAGASASLLLALSGTRLGLPVVAVPVLALLAAAAVAGLAGLQRRGADPLVPPAVLAAPGVRTGLVGALVAYMVLFGPLVLLPQVLTSLGVAGTGVLLTALPAGFGLAALVAERLVPAGWSNGYRCGLGGVLATVSAAALALPLSPWALAAPLAVLGIGLGIYLPANNAAIMAAIPGGYAATAGGLVNMTRGLGTAFGVALVTAVLPAARVPEGSPRVGTVALLLAACGVIASIAGTRNGAPAGGREPRIAREESDDARPSGARARRGRWAG